MAKLKVDKMQTCGKAERSDQRVQPSNEFVLNISRLEPLQLWQLKQQEEGQEGIAAANEEKDGGEQEEEEEENSSRPGIDAGGELYHIQLSNYNTYSTLYTASTYIRLNI